MTLLVSKTGIEIEIPGIRRVDRKSPLRWLRKGWGDIRGNAGFSIGLGIIFVAIGYLATYVVWRAPWASRISSTATPRSSASKPSGSSSADAASSR